jgi:hypothetical protein
MPYKDPTSAAAIATKKRAMTKWRATQVARNRNQTPKTPHSHRLQQETDKRYNLRRYGLTREAYFTLLGEQNGLCANPACRMINDNGKMLCVDHDHVDNFFTLPFEEKAKYIRGLLCIKCNFGLGYLNNIARLTGAIEYLTNQKEG